VIPGISVTKSADDWPVAHLEAVEKRSFSTASQHDLANGLNTLEERALLQFV
jgi:hypothetical protein